MNLNRAIALTLLLVACGPAHISPFSPRERKFVAGEYAANKKGSRPNPGSIYSEAQPGLLEDTRALRIGDIVMIRINEHADAQGNAQTNLQKSSDREIGVNALMGIVPAIQKAYPSIDPSQLLNIAASSNFSGQGTTQRAGSLNGLIGVHVKQELPNGDLFIEGTKVVMINREEYHLYVSGVIRPSDIAPDNSVDSSLIADARVEFTGRGDIDTTTDRGWLTKILDFVNPF